MNVLDGMATFVRVVEAGSLSAAAKQLRVSTAAVSRQLSALEDELGTSLVARSTRRMTVTARGLDYYQRCLRILREVDDAQASARGSRTQGRLTISAPVPFGLGCVVPTMRSLLRHQPGLRIDLRLEDRRVDLLQEGVDVAIRVGSASPDSPDIIAHPLLSFRRVPVAAPAYLKRRGEPKAPQDLAKHDALVYASMATAGGCSGASASCVWPSQRCFAPTPCRRYESLHAMAPASRSCPAGTCGTS